MTTTGPGERPDRIEIGLDDLKDVPDAPRRPPPAPPPAARPAYPSPQTQRPAPPPAVPSGYGYAVPPYGPTSTNGMAIASLVCGILFLCGVGSILALVFGYMAKTQIRESGGREGGNGMATAGIVLGWIGVGLVILYIILYAGLIASLNSSGS